MLGAALLLTLPRQAPRGVEFGRLLDGVQTGRVTAVQVPDGAEGESFVWHEGPLRWYRTDGPFDARARLERAAAAEGGVRLSFADPDSDRLWYQVVRDADEPSWLVVAAGCLWVWLFVAMLVTREHSYANRWAWFWLFLVGGVGPILLLLKEPEPLRVRRRAPTLARPDLSPLSGPAGLAYAVFWAIALAVSASLFVLVVDGSGD